MNFSVLISVYHKDNPEYFKLALESISVNQTLKPKQIVIVEDGPISKELENVINIVSNRCPYIEWTIIKREHNSGLASALNIGLNACKYEYVARMDADDISLSSRFEKQFEFLKCHPEIIVLGSDIAEFNNQIGDLKSVRHVGAKTEDIISMAKKRTPFNHMSVVFKSSAIKKVGGYSEDFGKLEDYKLWVDLISEGYEFANINDSLVNVRIGNGFLERRSAKREITDWDNLQNHLLKIGLVNWYQVLRNKLSIRVFVYMPVRLKKLAYNLFLRK